MAEATALEMRDYMERSQHVSLTAHMHFINLLMDGKRQEAIECYRAAVKLDPANN